MRWRRTDRCRCPGRRSVRPRRTTRPGRPGTPPGPRGPRPAPWVRLSRRACRLRSFAARHRGTGTPVPAFGEPDVVAAGLALDVGQSLALDRAGQQHGRCAGGAGDTRQSRPQLLRIVPVDLQDRPPETAPTVPERLETHGLFRVTADLQP